MATSPDTTKMLVTSAVSDFLSSVSSAACSGSARYTWNVSTYEPIMAPENNRKALLDTTERQLVSTGARSALRSGSARFGGNAIN
ncbi:Uncharacterised protein [Mycobacteroides abscessus]|nr:Uncharacterised protein [Mycobacteroides abscessus]CPX99629.1 Uncharacterised protein [Mycobacteroides abscessus]SKZ01174.1 Uncharacterised protein [Mycobacteroides abscessus subsp. massiliense]